MKIDKYKWGKAAEKDRKKASDELTKMKLENNKSKMEAKDKINIAARLERKLTALEKENNELKRRLIDL